MPGNPADTSTAAHQAQMRVYRRMSPEARLRTASNMSLEMDELTRTGIRARHPGYTAEQVEDAVRVGRLGESLFRQAWPARQLVRP